MLSTSREAAGNCESWVLPSRTVESLLRKSKQMLHSLSWWNVTNSAQNTSVGIIHKITFFLPYFLLNRSLINWAKHRHRNRQAQISPDLSKGQQLTLIFLFLFHIVLINQNTSYFQTILLTLGGMTMLVIALLFAKLILLGWKQIATLVFSPDNLL